MIIACGCAADADLPTSTPRPDATAPRLEPTISAPADRWTIVEQKLAKGTQRDDVYAVTIPRDDFDVNHLDLGPVPTSAGIESSFHFFLCPCGKTSVLGQFVLQEHELNDVIDELRNAHIKIASVAPMMLSARPALYILRFHGEGDVETLATTLNSALEWTGRQHPAKAQ
jgi:hypothetical protein